MSQDTNKLLVTTNHSIRYILEQINPVLGETFYNPFMSNGNIIIEYCKYMQNKYNMLNSSDIIINSIIGCEPDIILYREALNNIHIILPMNKYEYIQLYNSDKTNIKFIKYDIILAILGKDNFYTIDDTLDKVGTNTKTVLILPTVILYSDEYIEFRKNLINNFNIIKVTVLYDFTILFFNKTKSTKHINYYNIIDGVEVFINCTDYNINNYRYMIVPYLDINKFTLSPVSIMALDIVLKELSNIFNLSGDENYIIQNISEYLTNGDKNTFNLSYVSKKAIDIISANYVNSNNILTKVNIHIMITAIKNNLNIGLYDDDHLISNKRPCDNIDNIDTPHIKKQCTV